MPCSRSATFLALFLATTGSAVAEPLCRLPAPVRSMVRHPDSGTVACAMTLRGVAFLSSADPKPQVHTEWPTLDALPVADGAFLLADRFGKLRLVQPGEDGVFAQKAEWPTEGIPTDLEARPPALFVAAGAAGLLSYEWPRPAEEPMLRGRFPFVDYSKEAIATADGRVYLADNLDTGLQVLKVTDLQRPTALAVQKAGFVESVAVSGTTVAVASRLNGAVIFDVSVVEKPRVAGHIPPSNPDRTFVRRVRFDRQGRLMVCETRTPARLFDLKTSGETITATLRGMLPDDSTPVSEAMELPDGAWLLAAEDGTLHRVGAP